MSRPPGELLAPPGREVSCRFLEEGRMLPLVVEPAGSDPSFDRDRFVTWLRGNRKWIGERLLACGGVLFRGFPLAGAEDFEACATALEPGLLPYTEGQSQRTRVRRNVYTSTEYPPAEDITLHNELSYVADAPKRLFFFCEVAPPKGGETPIADGRRAYRNMDPEVRGRFVDRRVRYVKNMHDGSGFGGKSWQEHFETEDRSVVEKYLNEGNVEFRWKENGTLWTSQVRPAAVEHPETGETTWFNQADLWHYTNIGKKGESLRRMLGEDNLPTNAYYGDGEPIAPEDLDHVRKLFWKEATIFPWQPGDFLVLDNRLAAHGRRAYTGDRRILVAMS